MKHTGAKVLDGGKRRRRTVDRDWLDGMPSTMARWFRSRPQGASDRRLYLREAGPGDGEQVGPRGEGR